ncbi:terminase GpA [Nitratifractor salsuginis DSM 16511]|uniref:Terminase GpA n=2 Tax=Nitratifractor salsuginis TaxID=269261 RepID=E6X1P8_NITSE|nr:terminase GpA [Nitratifractor salsuginis DSM 16511]
MSKELVENGFGISFKPDPIIPIDEWSDTYRILPSESSAEPGRYRTDRMPYLKEIARELSPQSPTQRVSVMKGVQLGFTELANNMIFTYADLYPCPMLMILPTESLAQTHASDKLWPSIEKTPRIAEKIYPRKKDGGSSKLDIRFPGGNLRIAYAFTTSTFASVSRRVVIKDDLDRWPDDVKGEGNPSALADKRADAFPNKKIYANSSPTLLKTSKIYREYMDGSQAVYDVPCPHCGEMFDLNKDRFVYEWDTEHYKLTGAVMCECPHCGEKIPETKKHVMTKDGKWRHKYPDRLHKSYRIPSWYSPFLPWTDIVQEYLTALKVQDEGIVDDMKTWVNTREAWVWEEEIHATQDIEILKLRADTPEAVVPPRTALLTMAVDVQVDHFWFEIRAYQYGNAKRTIRYGRVETWTDIEDLFRAHYLDEKGQPYAVKVCAIDSGYRTDEVYEFCAMNLDVAIPVKGVEKMTVPYKVTTVTKEKDGRSFTTGLKLYLLNTMYYKDMFDAQIKRSLALEEKGQLLSSDNVVTLHSEADGTIAEQWTSEYKAEEVNKKTGAVKMSWRKIRPKAPNHLWDCGVYNTFLGDLMGVKFLRPKPVVKRERKARASNPASNYMDEF